jgi:hypothetical protein
MTLPILVADLPQPIEKAAARERPGRIASWDRSSPARMLIAVDSDRQEK